MTCVASRPQSVLLSAHASQQRPSLCYLVCVLFSSGYCGRVCMLIPEWLLGVYIVYCCGAAALWLGSR